MHSLAINTLTRSKHFVCNLALVIAAMLFAAQTGTTQQLQQGVSVQLAPTTNATPMPAADNDDAWIVAITADGSLFFGVDKVTPEELADKMKSIPRRRDQNLYVKADARAPFADVQQVLEAGHEVAFEAAVLLTAQPVAPAPGTMAPPNGLEVLVGPALPAGTVATVVQLVISGQQQPVLKVNGDEIPRSALEGTLGRHFQKGDEKVILLKADPRLRFGQVAQVIDTSRAMGAKVVLDTPGL